MKTASLLSLPDAPAVSISLLDTFRDYADVSSAHNTHVVRFRYGQATFTVQSDRIAITAEAEDEIQLSYVKMTVAEHWTTHPRGPEQKIAWDDLSATDDNPAFCQSIEVVASRMVTPGIRRVTFRGKDFSAYTEGGLHIRLLFPPADRKPVWPSVGADGRIVWPDGADTLSARVYTLRRMEVSSAEIDIDFVLHEACGEPAPGATFGHNARTGQVVGIFAPAGNDIPPAADLLLLGDDTALPAMARIVEALPASATARVFAEVDSPADRYDFQTRSNVDVTYLYRNGRKPGTAALLPAVLKDCLPSSAGALPYLWTGCELDDYKIIRRYAREELKLARDRQSVVAYWRKS